MRDDYEEIRHIHTVQWKLYLHGSHNDIDDHQSNDLMGILKLIFINIYFPSKSIFKLVTLKNVS